MIYSRNLFSVMFGFNMPEITGAFAYGVSWDKEVSRPDRKDRPVESVLQQEQPQGPDARLLGHTSRRTITATWNINHWWIC